MNLEEIMVPTLNDEEWDKAKNLARDWCKGGLGDTNLMPHLFIWSTAELSKPGGPFEWGPVELMLMACGFDWNNDSKRAFIKSVAGKMVRERRIPIAVLFAHEAWQSHRPLPPNLTDEQIKEEMRKAPMPSDDPYAIEVLCCAGLRIIGPEGKAQPVNPMEHPCWGWTQKVKRDSEDKMVADGEPVETTGHRPQFLYSLLLQFARYAAKYEPLPPDDGALTMSKLDTD